MKLKYWIYIGIAAVLVIAVLIYYRSYNRVKVNSAEQPPKQQPQQMRGAQGGGRLLPVSVFIADYGTANEGNSYVGVLRSKQSVRISSELSGKIVSIDFEEGQFVRKGDVLVRLDDRELQSQLSRAEFQLQLLSERVKRQEILLDKEAVSREAYDQVLTEYNVLKEDIEQIKIRIDKSNIKAPFDGVLGMREVSVGAYLQPNSSIVNLVDIRNMIVEFSLNEKNVATVRNGMNCYFTLEGVSKEYRAKIYAIDSQLDDYTRTLMLRAEFVNVDSFLRPGMSVNINLSQREGRESIFVPNEAIVQSARGRAVWLKRNGKANLVNITTGLRNEDMIEINTGLSKGDSVIVSGILQLREGSNVMVEQIINKSGL